MTKDMKTILTRLFTVIMLMMISMATRADVKVLYGEKGTDKFEGKGGSIKIEQADSKNDKTKVTVYLTFIPQSGYTFDDSTLEVYAVTSPDGASTRAPEISGDPLKLTEEKTDVPSAKRYSVDIDPALALWVKVAEFLNGRKDPDYSGTYYIGSRGYAVANTTTNYYLCPTEGWAFYKATNDVQAADNGQPFLTTYQCRNGSYDATKAVWIVEKKSDSGCYYIKQALTGKYLVSNSVLTGAGNTRARVHLETVADAALATLGDWALFEINYDNGHYDILPHSTYGRDGASNIYLVVNTNNYNQLDGNKIKTNGPTGFSSCGGIIGLYKHPDDGNAYFYFEVPTPTISQSAASISISHVFTDVDIYYTTDGTNPTSSSTLYEGTFTPVISSKQVKAIAISRESGINSAVATYSLPKLDAPTISVVIPNPSDVTTSGTATITTSVDGATIFYTTNKNNPNTSSSTTTGDVPFTGPKTIKAVVGKAGYAMSDVTTKQIIQVATPTFRDNGNLAVIIESGTPNAEIHYVSGDTEPSDPDDSSPTYSVPLIGMKDKYIKAIAIKSENYHSVVASSGKVTFNCAKPVIKRIAGDKFTIICSNPANAIIHYTTNGDTPTASDPGISSGAEVNITGSLPLTIKAIAMASGFDPSDEATLVISDNELSGSGTADDPFQIATSNDFSLFITKAGTPEGASAYYMLTANISLSGSSYSSITFTAIFDGDGYTISDLDHALFNTVNGGVVKNVMIDNVNISGGTNAGAIANKVTGTSSKIGSIYNCGVLSGSISGSGYVGSIVGQLGDSNNDNCYARVINCFSYATVGGGTDVGGIVGYNDFASTAANIRTMVMNCMFYGDITGGTNKSPVYGGDNINNLQGGLNTFNYYAYEQLPTSHISSGKYNCALAVEDKYLNRFEFYRLLLNSNKKLAAFYATGSQKNANEMAKWVLETADRSISGRNPYPYPILKAQGYYPSIINYDTRNLENYSEENRNKGLKTGTLTVNISSVGSNAPTGASITTGSLTLVRTDKDFDHFNYNYDKVQLPYYNDVGTGNYTGNRVVTGWKVTAITSVENDPYTKANYDYTKTYASNASYFDSPNYNFADRKSSNKDLYSVSGRVFSQGAYFDVPYGVESITIEPYWGKAYYIADQYYDVVYKADYSGKQGVSQTGTQVNTNTTLFNGQKVETSITRSLDAINNDLGGLGSTVYDNALVLVGNLHLDVVPLNGDRPFTMMSVDTDNDHEPDYSLIYHHKSRSNITPIRFDFLAVPGTAQAQKPNGASLICNFTIFKTRGWFEVTNTAFMYSDQLEYENGDLGDGVTKIDAPLILLGGIFDQFVSTQSSAVNGHTIYIHVGGNVWINEFGMGTHSDGSQSTPHVPVSVTGGEFPGFYLTGTYKADAKVRSDNAECYISGGYFHEAAGASLEQIDGNVRWQIYNADIDDFFGGGINDAKPIKGGVTVDIFNSHVTNYCGGPKFGNMQEGKKVTTNAEGCVFGTYFGAGYGGTSLAKKKYYDKDGSQNWATLQGYYTTDRAKYFDGSSTGASQISGKDYGKKGPGVATDFDYEFFVWSSGTTGARFYVKFASFSLAQCHDVESKLKGCTVENNFYGGGSLGKVTGTVTSELDGCTVKGNVFGAGYSALLPTLEVRDAGFTNDPNFNSASGMFEPGVFSGTTTFTWKNASEAGVTLTDKGSGSDLTNKYIYTNMDITNTNLGSVEGNVNLTIKGNSKIGTEGDTTKGNVYGGGEQSRVNGSAYTVTVNLKGDVQVLGNVFGGGDNGVVEGNTVVNIKDSAE